MRAPQKQAATAALAVVLVCMFLPAGLGQTRTEFTSQTVFNIPDLQGSIRFALNGSYTSVTLQDGTWIFEDLSLNGSRVIGTLKVSAENSDITVFTYRARSILGSTESIRYFAQGQGKQTFDLGVNATGQTHPDEWWVLNNEASIANRQGWSLAQGNVVVVEGLVGNVSITHFGFYSIPTGTGNFFVDHSIALIVAVALLVTIGVCLIVRFKVMKS